MPKRACPDLVIRWRANSPEGAVRLTTEALIVLGVILLIAELTT